MRGFDKLATVAAQVKRRPAPDADGLTGDLAVVVRKLMTTGLTVLNRGEDKVREAGPTLQHETRCKSGYDIQPGDWLVVAGHSYLVRAVVPYLWTPTGDTLLRLVVEEIQA